MKNGIKLGLMMLVLIFSLSGCFRTSPVVNIVNSPVAAKNIGMENIFKAIVKAGAELGWTVRKVKEGEAEATLYIRSHVAVVKIEYNNERYNILYQHSSNLKYDAGKNTIHSNYNGWVSNLNGAIQKHLQLMSI